MAPSPSIARIVTLVIALVLLILSLVSLGAVFQGGWETNTSDITGIVVAVIIFLCIIFGVIGAILMNRLMLLIYTAFCGVLFVLALISAVIFAVDSNWYGMSMYILIAIFWFVAAYFAFVLHRFAH